MASDKTINIDIKVNAPTLKELRTNLKELKTDVADATNNTVIKKFNKEIDNLNKTIKEVVESGSDLGATFEEVYGDLLPLSTQISEAEDRLYQLAAAGKTNTEEFQKLATQTAKNKQLILETDKAVDIMANNRGLASFGTNVKDIGASLLTLDFKSASDQATALAKNAKNISFGDAIKSVKQLGSTFINLGKALLANPLFLIAAIVALIIVKMDLLKPILKIVGAYFELLGDILDAIIQPLKDLTDWLGLTAFAATEAAEKTADSAKKSADAVELNGNRQIQTLSNQMRIAKAEGKETTQLERQKVVLLAQTAKARYEEAQAAYKAAVLKGDLDANEIADLKEKAVLLRDVSKQAREEISLFDIEKNAEKNTKIAADDKEAADARKAAWDKRKQDIAANKEFQLKTSREIKDIELSLIEDETERILAINAEKYKRLEEDTKKNNQLSAAQKKTFLELFDKQEQAVIDEINAKKKEKEIKAQEEVNLIISELKMSAEEKEFDEIDAKYDAKKQKLIDNATEEYKLTQKFISALALLEAQAEVEKEQMILDKDEADKEKRNADIIAKLEENSNTLAGQKALLDEQMLQELDNAELTGEQRAAIEEKYRQLKVDADMAAAQKGLATASQGINAIQGLSDALFANKMSKLEKGSAAELKAAKKQFKITKQLQIAQAIIQGVQATLSAFSSGSAIPVVGAIMGPLYAGIAAVTAVASVAKIKNSKFEGGGGGASAAGGGAGAAAVASAESAVPSFNMFGKGNDENNISSSTDREATQNINVNASISVDEVTDKQKNLARISESGTLSL